MAEHSFVPHKWAAEMTVVIAGTVANVSALGLGTQGGVLITPKQYELIVNEFVRRGYPVIYATPSRTIVASINDSTKGLMCEYDNDWSIGFYDDEF